MSMIDKQILLKDLETALGDIVTANERDWLKLPEV